MFHPFPKRLAACDPLFLLSPVSYDRYIKIGKHNMLQCAPTINENHKMHSLITCHFFFRAPNSATFLLSSSSHGETPPWRHKYNILVLMDALRRHQRISRNIALPDRMKYSLNNTPLPPRSHAASNPTQLCGLGETVRKAPTRHLEVNASRAQCATQPCMTRRRSFLLQSVVDL